MSAAPCTKCGTRGGGMNGRRRRERCDRCYQADLSAGRFDDVRAIRRWADVLEDLDWLGFDRRLPIKPQLRELAPRLGMTYNALARGWERHRARERNEQRRSA